MSCHECMKTYFENKIAKNQISFRLTDKTSFTIGHHTYVKKFGIPIHKYIIQKKLIYAKRIVENGEQFCKIYPAAGFKDYSSLL